MKFLKRLWKRLFGEKAETPKKASCRGNGRVMGNRLSGGRNIGAGV